MGKQGKMGAWAFIVGVIVALALGLLPASLQSVGVPVLVVLGLVVGFLNVTEKETSQYIMAAVAIMIAVYTAGSAIDAQLESLGRIGGYLVGLLSNINIFVFPATIVVALKAIYGISKD